jgi:hypothetical protein
MFEKLFKMDLKKKKRKKQTKPIYPFSPPRPAPFKTQRPTLSFFFFPRDAFQPTPSIPPAHFFFSLRAG